MLITSMTYAQKYFPQPELQKFAGTWEYSGNNKTFKIILKIKIEKAFGMSFDAIQGQYVYILNHKVVQNSKGQMKPGIIQGLVHEEKSPNSLEFVFNDIGKNKWGHGILKLLPGKMNEAIWILRNKETVIVGSKNSTPYDYSFSVPIKLKLYKIQ